MRQSDAMMACQPLQTAGASSQGAFPEPPSSKHASRLSMAQEAGKIQSHSDAIAQRTERLERELRERRSGAAPEQHPGPGQEDASGSHSDLYVDTRGMAVSAAAYPADCALDTGATGGAVHRQAALGHRVGAAADYAGPASTSGRQSHPEGRFRSDRTSQGRGAGKRQGAHAQPAAARSVGCSAVPAW